MPALKNLFFAASGLVLALLTVSFLRASPGSFGIIQYPVIALILAVFFLDIEKTASLAVGLGLGLDILSSYPFLSWTLILALTAAGGHYISRTVLTNRSLLSLFLLGIAMRLFYFVSELLVSRVSVFVGGTVWYTLSGVKAGKVAGAIGLETLILMACFIVYVRVRGERTRMLTHL